MEHLTNVGEDSLEEFFLAKQIATRQSSSPFDVGIALGYQTKYERHQQVDLVQVGDVVDKRQHLACVDETDGRGIAGADDAGMHQTVQARACRRQRAVEGIAAFPMVGIVASPCPR